MNATKQKMSKSLLYNILFVLMTTAVWADVSGTIFRDFNLNGTQDTLEPGISGLTVTAYDDNGAVGLSQTTDADGHYTLATGAGKFRVEVTNVPTYLKAGTAINGSTSALVSIVDNGDTHHVGLHNAGQYCQANPDIIMTRFTKGDNNGGNSGTNTVLQFPYTANGEDAPTNISAYSDVGSVYGVSHLRKANVTYTSTYLKRHADIGPSGIGAIYKIDHANGNAVSTFATLPGTDPRNAGAGYDWGHDTVGYTSVGKTGIGDIELSDDESQLFAVNMDDKKLYVYDVDANGNAGANTSYTIPNPCANAIDFRPMGLGFHDGILYVGTTCTAESTVDANNADHSTNGPRKGDKSQLSAHIYSFVPAITTFSATPVLNIDLTYDRGCIYNADISNAEPNTDCTYTDHDGISQPYRANWNPWQMDYDIVFNDKAPGDIGNQDGWIEYMQPLLSDIEFDNDGSMIIAIRDVNGDRTGNENHSPNPADNDTHNGNGEGDILRACGNPQAGWTLESNGQCGGITTGGANTHEGLGGGEYYWYDNGPGGNGHSAIGYTGTAGHSDTIMGGLLHVAGHNDVVTGVMDAHRFLDNGLIWLRNDTGEISRDANNDPKRLLISSSNSDAFYGKASGIGDLEALCDAAPIEIGNYVWEDTDGDGIQDPDEAVLAGVTVNLYEGATLVGTAITGANGEYYFGGSTNANMVGGNPLKPLTAYQLRIDLDDANLGARVPTQKDVNANADDIHDSDGDNGVLNPGFSSIAYTTGTAGNNDHTLDFGFTNPVSIGSIVWNDANNNGVQDAGESGINGATVELLDGAGNVVDTQTTDNTGLYYFDNLPEGDYRVRVTPPAGMVKSTNQTTADNNDAANDSNIATSAGNVHTSGLFTLSNDGEPDGVNSNIAGSDDADNADDNNGNMTVDFGFYTPVVSIGSIVWNDANNNGVQDAGESGINGATVELLDGAGNVVDTQTTDNTGLYYFDNLPEGDYRVRVTPPAGMVKSTNQTTADNNDAANDSNIATSAGNVHTSGLFTLSNDGEPDGVNSNIAGSDDADNADDNNGNMTVDFGFYTPAVSIGSIVWNDANNNGVQDAGESGINGATVELLDGAGNVVDTQTTDNTGLYYFDNLPEGDYRVRVTPPAGMVKSTNQTTADNNDAANDSNIATSAGNVHTSGLFTLSNDGEPDGVNSNIAGSDDADNADDNNGNMTVDFGFYAIFDLALVKTLNAGTVTPIVPGADVIFDIKVINQGTVDATEIQVNEYLPTGLILNDAAWTENAGVATLNTPIAALAAGAETTVSVTCTVDADFQGSSIVNNAEIASATNALGLDDVDSIPGSEDGSVPDPLNDDTAATDGSDDYDPETISIGQTFDLALVKTLNAGTVTPIVPGADVIFDIKVINQGTVDATEIQVNEYLPTGLILNDAAWTENAGVATLNTPIAALAAGAETTVSVTCTVDADFQGSSIVNNAEIASATNALGLDDVDSIPGSEDGSVPDPLNDDTAATDGSDDYDPETISIGQTFDLALVKTLNAGTVTPIVPGADVIFDIKVINQGTVDATEIQVNEYLPTGLILNDAAWTENAGVATLNTPIAALAAGAETTVSVTCTVDADFQGSSIVNNAEIASATNALGLDDVDSIPGSEDGSVPDPLNDDTAATDGSDDYDPETISIGQTFDLALVKTLNAGTVTPIVPGADVIFDIKVINQGTVDATEIQVNEYLPTGLILNDAAWTENAGVATLNTPIAALAAGAETTVSVTCTVDADFQGSSIVNNAEIASATNALGLDDVDSIPGSEDGSVPDPLNDDTAATDGSDDYDPETISIGQTFDLALVKTLNAGTVTPIVPGADVIFDIKVINQGTVDATEIQVNEYLPTGLILNDAVWTENAGVATLNTPIAALAAGAETTVSVTCTVDADFQGSSIVNNAEIASATNALGLDDVDSIPGSEDGSVPDPLNDDTAATDGSDDYDPETISIGQTFDLALVKTLNAGTVTPIVPGADVIFDIKVINQGTVDATEIQVNEYLPTGLILNDAAWTENAGVATLNTPIAALAAGAETTVSVTCTVDADFQGSSIVNNAEIASATNALGLDDVDSIPGSEDGSVPDPLNDDTAATDGSDDYDPETISIGQTFDLALVKTLNAGTVTPIVPGADVIFDIKVINQGTVDATEIQVNEYLPTGLILNDAAWTENAGVATLNTPIAALAAGAETTVSVTCTVDADFQGSSIVNNAEIASATNALGLDDVDSIPGSEDGSVPDPLNDDTAATDGSDDYDPETISIGQTFDLALVKTLNAGTVTPIVPGADVIFDIKVINQGTVDATEIQVNEYLPTGLILNDAAWTENAGVATLNTPIAALAAGAETTVSVTCTVDADFQGSSIVNNAEIASATNALGLDDVDSIPGSEDGSVPDPLNDDTAATDGSDDYDPETISIGQTFDLALVKTLNAGTVTPIVPGADVIFDIKVINQGTVDATEIQVNEYLPTGLILNDAAWTENAGVATLNTPIAALAAGAETTVSVTCTVDADFQGSSIVNNAEIASATNALGLDDVDSIPGSEDGSVPDPLNDDTAATDGSDDYDPETITIQPILVHIGDLVWIEDDNDGDATTGTITYPPEGTVVTATASGGTTYTGTTDVNGSYLIEVPANDTYVVTVGTPSGMIPTAGSENNTVPDDNSENNTSHNGAGTTVVVGTTDNLTLDFGFTPPEVPNVFIGDLVWIEDDNDGDATTGTITYPPEGTVVTATASGGTTYTGTTDVNGSYLIEVPANDTYVVTVGTPSGMIPTAGSENSTVPDDNSENNTSHNGAGTTVVVGTTDNLTLDFGFTDSGDEPDPTASIGNLFWVDSNANGVVDDGERGVNGVTVQLLDDNGNVLETQITRNGPDGQPGYYLFEGLTPGQAYQVHFDYSNVPELEGYVYSPLIGGNDSNNANDQGFTVPVVPQEGDSILTIDAGIYCGCALVSSDSSDALGFFEILVMMAIMFGIALFFIRREENLLYRTGKN